MVTMSASKVDESPNHFMVMDAISKGAKTVDKISRATKVPKNEVQEIANDLVTQRLAVSIEKKGFLGGKKVELGITDTGLKLLNTKKEELQKEANKIQQWYDNGNTDQVRSYMDNNRAWIPMMMFSGIMNAMFFMSMMSMMDMAMLPGESAFAGDPSGGADPSGGTFDAGSSGGDFSGGGGDFSF